MMTSTSAPVAASVVKPSPRILKAARDFQTTMLSELLKPLAPAMVGNSLGQENDALAREFYGFMMIEAIARDITARDGLGLHKVLIDRMTAGTRTGGEA
ncbi:MAG: hypothetical protein FJX60_23325 [Alphaproteobacteria bacterium]|nr:hypothetical protein [Alphaproteobacteria bacterium]